MTLKYGDRVRETTTTTGTGTINLAGAEAKYQAFNDILDTNDTCYYAIVHRSANEWEVGYGTFTDAAPDTLARNTVIASSNANAAVSFAAGTKDVFLTLPAITAAERPGFIKDYGGTTAPEGYLACDGSNVSRTTYKPLFDAIGTTWGIGDGSLTFTLPDFRRRTAVGSGGSGTATLAATVGSVGGAETHTLATAELPAHGHAFSVTSGNNSVGHTHSGTTGNQSADHSHSGSTGTESADHAHYAYPYVDDGSGSQAVASVGFNASGANHGTPFAITGGRTAAHTHSFTTGGVSANHTHSFTSGGVSANHTHSVSGTTDNAGSGNAHNNIQPSAVVLKVIKT